jgi:hypothetical protein
VSKAIQIQKKPVAPQSQLPVVSIGISRDKNATPIHHVHHMPLSSAQNKSKQPSTYDNLIYEQLHGEYTSM